MAMALPRPPKRLVAACALGWALCTAVIVAVDDDGRLGTLLDEMLGTLGTLFAAVVIGSGILGWWQSREWTRRTQFIVLGLASWAGRELINVIDDVMAVAYENQTAESVLWASDLFALPLSEVQKEAILHEAENIDKVIVNSVLASRGGTEDTAEDRAAAERMNLKAADLRARADVLFDLSLRLGDFVDDKSGPPLVAAAVHFHHSVQRMLDPMPGTAVPAFALRMFNATGACGDVLREGSSLAEALSTILEGLSESSDPQVLKELATSRKGRAELEDRIWDMRKEHDDLRAFLSD